MYKVVSIDVKHLTAVKYFNKVHVKLLGRSLADGLREKPHQKNVYILSEC